MVGMMNSNPNSREKLASLVNSAKLAMDIPSKLQPVRQLKQDLVRKFVTDDPDVLAEVSCGLGEALVGLNLTDEKVERFANRSD